MDSVENIWSSILNERNMTINESHNLDSELICPLTDFSILEITGNDRFDFLQNQLTGDLSKSETKSEFSSWCNLKGRVITNFLILNIKKSYILVLKKDMKDYVLEKLKMYILRSDTKINDVTEKVLLVGLVNYKNPLSVAPENASIEDGDVIKIEGCSGHLTKLPDFSSRYLIIADAKMMPNVLSLIDKHREIAVNSKIWNHFDILAGFAWIDFENKEKYLPQMLNLDKFGAVSFSKGCYVGQEVIARLHHRGKVKKTLKLIKTENNYKLKAGDYLYQDDSSKKIGEILNIDSISNVSHGLAVIESDKLDSPIYADVEKKNKLKILPINTN